VRALLAGVFLAQLLGLVQILVAPSFGNDPAWARIHRINASFTDPNALGVYMALVFPLAAAMALGASDRWTRQAGAAVAILCLAMLAGAGSRTGMLGVLLALVVFPVLLALRFPCESDRFRQRVLSAVLALTIGIVAFVPLDCRWQPERWPLLDRLARTREMIAREGVLAPLVRERWPLWEPAVDITLDYPLGGIGLGAYRYEVDNIQRLGRYGWKRRLDNANNFYLQVSSELGLLGLAVILAVFLAVGCCILRGVRSPRLEGEGRFVYLGIATGWLGLLALFLTGPHVEFEQVQLTFWLFAALVVSQESSRSAPTLSGQRRAILLGIAVIGTLAAMQLHRGFGDLSLAHRRAALGLEKAEGFYSWEMDRTRRRFRWTGAVARQEISTSHNEIRIELHANHPDLETTPLTVWISLDGKLVAQPRIDSRRWQWIRIAVPPDTPDPAELRIHVDRTWRPSDHGAAGDDRDLGVGISRIENVDAGVPLPS
jgi:O-antigen ligase